ncbi:sigma-70 family RNA polymerase sigma factor, partial [Nocardioides massiliensis]
RRIQELSPRIARAREDLQQRFGRPARPTEIAEELEVPLEEVVEALTADGCFSPTSLEAPVGTNGTVADRLAEDDADMELAEARILLSQAFSHLSERDRTIIDLRFFKGWTQEQVGEEIGVSQMQVSRLLRRILGDLRREIAA